MCVCVCKQDHHIRTWTFFLTVFGSGAKIEEACFDAVAGAGRRRKGNGEAGESGGSGRHLHLGESSF